MKFVKAMMLATILAGCEGASDMMQPATPDVTQEVVQRVLAMDCAELAATEQLLALIEQGQGLVRLLLASGQLAGTGVNEGLIAQGEAARRQTGQLVDFMQLIRLCRT